jgi:hypothetical protein
MKYYVVKMSDGRKIAVPLSIIAESYADYYVIEVDEAERQLLDDEFLCQDWATNNMNWVEVKDHSIEIEPPSGVDLDDMWTNPSNTEIVDLDPK